MSTLDERVAAGAAYLDEHDPGWERLIDLASLDLGDSCRCVLAQIEYAITDKETMCIGLDPFVLSLSGSTRSGFAEALIRIGVGPVWADDHGFAVDGGKWADLDEAWITCIKDRFDRGALSG